MNKLKELQTELDGHYKINAIVYSRELFLKGEIKNLEKKISIDEKESLFEIQVLFAIAFVVTISFIFLFF